jgi:hypothetical protein
MPDEDLQKIADLNCVAHGLYFYLASNHEDIFRQSGAEKKDYAVAWYNEDKAEEFLNCFRELSKAKVVQSISMPKPEVSFFGKRDEAMAMLAHRPYTAIAWRLSPAMEAMF